MVLLNSIFLYVPLFLFHCTLHYWWSSIPGHLHCGYYVITCYTLIHYFSKYVEQSKSGRNVMYKIYLLIQLNDSSKIVCSPYLFVTDFSWGMKNWNHFLWVFFHWNFLIICSLLHMFDAIFFTLCCCTWELLSDISVQPLSFLWFLFSV